MGTRVRRFFKHFLDSGSNFAEIIACTGRLRQRAALGHSVARQTLDEALGHHLAHQIIRSTGHSCASKIMILSYLWHRHIDTKLATTMANWVEEHSDYSIGSPHSAGGMTVRLLTTEDLRGWNGVQSSLLTGSIIQILLS